MYVRVCVEAAAAAARCSREVRERDSLEVRERVHEMAQHTVGSSWYQGAWSRWLNDQASWNIICIFVALSTRQSFSGWLNDEACAYIMLIFVTLSTRQFVQRLVERRSPYYGITPP